ncbi:MAG: outer membrane protein assembly factor BamD, partial [Actinomycetota bacterium]|nr:outer membrane protein assembly factor BamD [Actinomycetota bacterium]
AFDTVTGPFELTLSADVLDARDRSVECAAYEKARAAQNRDDYESAIVLYDDFGKLYPQSVLLPYVHDNLADTHLAKATSWQEPLTAVTARLSVDTLLMLGREFEDTEAAKKAPAEIAAVFAAATKPYGAGKFCESLEVLTYFAGLDAASVGKKVSADANTFRARSLYECGMRKYKDKKLSDAVTDFDEFLRFYPKDRRVAQAKAALIAAKVAIATKATIPVPPPLGGNNPGPTPITFYNDSQDPVTIYIAGPTAHEITLPACPSCPATYRENDPAACANLNGRPSVTVRLKTSTYYYLATSSGWAEDLAEPFTLEANYEYDQCLYATPR